MIFWLPSFFARTYGLGLIEVSQFYGSIILIGGIAGIWAGGWLGDRLGRGNRAAYARIPAIAFLIAAPCYAVGVMSNTLTLTYAMFLIPQALGLMWLGPVLSAVQHLAPASMRTTASAIFLFINNLIGIGLGTLLFGLISDRLAPSFGDQSLRYSILIGLVFYLVSALLFFLASRRLDRDWEA